MKVIAASLLALLALTGCAGKSTSAVSYTNKPECEAAGGTWSEVTNSCTLSPALAEPIFGVARPVMSSQARQPLDQFSNRWDSMWESRSRPDAIQQMALATHQTYVDLLAAARQDLFPSQPAAGTSG